MLILVEGNAASAGLRWPNPPAEETTMSANLCKLLCAAGLSLGGFANPGDAATLVPAPAASAAVVRDDTVYQDLSAGAAEDDAASLKSNGVCNYLCRP
jgi:hypothetical protein